MHQHHQSANPHKVGAVGEPDEEYGGDVMDDLLLEVLEHTHEHTETTQCEEDMQCITNTSAALHLCSCASVICKRKDSRFKFSWSDLLLWLKLRYL